MGWFLIPTLGVYILVIELLEDVCLNVGLLGHVCLFKGLYGYVGSAKGFGGIEARVRYHMSKTKKKLWWHIDYITTLSKSNIRYVVYAETLNIGEEDVVNVILESNCWATAIQGFGSTDRRSVTHLFRCSCEPHVCIEELSSILAKLGLKPKVIVPEQPT